MTHLANKRVPSWCDRILWHQTSKGDFVKLKEYLKPISYERKETLYGDHKPVAAYFKIYGVDLPFKN